MTVELVYLTYIQSDKGTWATKQQQQQQQQQN